MPCFDGLRGLAATGVILIHASIFTVWVTHPMIRDLIGQIRVAVEVFFIISGFLLYRPFIAARLDGRPRPGWRTYATNRAARLFPAYWCALIVTVVVMGQGDLSSPKLWISHLLLLGVVDQNTRTAGLPVAWTLSIELGFYLFLPFLAIFVDRALERMKPVRAELAGIVGLAVIGVCVQLVVANVHNYLGWVSTAFYLPVFAVGMAFALMHEVTIRRPEPHPLYALVSRHAGIAWLTAGVLLVTTAQWLSPVGNFALKQSLSLDTIFTVAGALLVVPAVFVKREVRDRGALRAFLNIPVIAYLGVVSYGMYLWHYQIIQMVRSDWFGWPELGGRAVVLFPIAFVLTLAVATASWYLLERPILRVVKPRDRRGEGTSRRSNARNVARPGAD